MGLIEDYLNEVDTCIGNERTRKIVNRRVAKRLITRIDELKAGKYDNESAIQTAVDEIGDAKTLALQLEKANERKKLTIPILLAFVLFILFYIYFSAFSDVTSHYINFVDWYEHDFMSDWLSTILFCGFSIFIFIGLKTKNKLIFWIMGIFLFASLLFSAFTGLFQPFWYGFVYVITKGWSAYSVQLFSISEEYGGIVGTIALAVFGLLTQILLGVYCFNATNKIKLEQNGTAKKGQWKKLNIFSYCFLSLSLLSFVIISAGTYVGVRDNDSVWDAINHDAKQDYKRALNIYYNLEKVDIMANYKKGIYNVFDSNSTTLETSVASNGVLEKRVFSAIGENSDKKIIQKVKTGMTVEDFKKILPPLKSIDIRCTYSKNGDVKELYSYQNLHWFSTDYYDFTFMNGILTKITSSSFDGFNNMFYY